MKCGPCFGGRLVVRQPENRRKMYPRHVLPLVRYYTGTSEGAPQPWPGVEQSSMSKYLDMAADILRQIVVSSKFLTGLLDMAESVDDIMEPVPHLRLLADSMNILRYRLGDKAQKKVSYGGKKKRFIYNVQVITNCAGPILNISEAR